MSDSCGVVFGPGRSGTSVAMKMLDQAGLRLSRELIPESNDNPDGYFEDQVIADVLQRFVGALDLAPFSPRPDTWTDAADYHSTRTALVRAVESELAAGPAPWGFKNPLTSLTWQMWQEIFEIVGLTPAPVFCSRNAASVVSSLMRAYGFSQQRAEALYLYRGLHALEDVTEQWFFVQYDDWADNGGEQLLGLAAHCGIDVSSFDAPSVVAANFATTLDRQSVGPTLRLSGAVRDLDQLLTTCRATTYDRAAIAEFCRSVHAGVDAFGFVHEALELERRQSAARVSARFRRLAGPARRAVRSLRP